jgi:hypothetical protein
MAPTSVISCGDETASGAAETVEPPGSLLLGPRARAFVMCVSGADGVAGELSPEGETTRSFLGPSAATWGPRARIFASAGLIRPASFPFAAEYGFTVGVVAVGRLADGKPRTELAVSRAGFGSGATSVLTTSAMNLPASLGLEIGSGSTKMAGSGLGIGEMTSGSAVGVIFSASGGGDEGCSAAESAGDIGRVCSSSRLTVVVLFIS